MRERAISTIGVWLSSALSIYLLLQRLTYTEYEMIQIVADGPYVSEPTMMFAPFVWQVAIFALVFFVLCIAGSATYFIWEKAHKEPQAAREQTSAKQKREHKARVGRLLERMDDDELSMLERRLSDDGELASLHDLLDQRRR